MDRRLWDAVATSVNGFARMRSITKPYLVHACPFGWVVRDGPTVKDRRTTEVFAVDADPREVAEYVLRHVPERHAVCAVRSHDGERQARDDWRAAGYRLRCREGIFVRPLVDAPDGQAIRVEAVETATDLARAMGGRSAGPKYVNPDWRLYGVRDGDEWAGWVRSIDVGGPARYVAALEVRPEFRRRGHATALMAALLRDDVREGKSSALIASTVGGKLYPSLGYERLGTLDLFSPMGVKR